MERVNIGMVTSQPQRNGREGLTLITQLSRSYGVKVSEIIQTSRAGLPAQVIGEEFQLLIAQWVEILGGIVPEHRLNDCYLHSARTRDSSFPMSATDMCTAWKQIQEAERAMPPIGSYEWSRAREVCPKCNNTGTVLFVKRDATLGRDYTYAKHCYH